VTRAGAPSFSSRRARLALSRARSLRTRGRLSPSTASTWERSSRAPDAGPLDGNNGQAMSQENVEQHDLPLGEYHRAGRELTNGNPEVYKELYSRRDDVTVANPFGPPVRGWSDVSATLDRAAQNYRDGEIVGFENVSTVIAPDLAYTLEIESYRARVGGADDLAPVSLRVTTLFRREDGVWKVVHRHADPITAKRPPRSVIQE
jgi:ketosteroid isomerase-like protein